METATLTSPPRPVMVQPIQKSLSLPSYARAGGEGIDHKLIFAALEQREKVRRKSKIFKDKEKTGATRQNYFCLPLPSGKKCRETSLSSDTSCSSLEFQKPKVSTSLPKGVEIPHHEQNGVKDNPSPSPEANVKTDVNNNSDEGNHVPIEVPVEKECVKKDKLRGDTSRSTIGSSDSMERTERSSRSSNDSISKKERLVAIKARVEAERERKLCDSSSDEETTLRITRHNSDGVIHRTVREVKSKSSRGEKRFRRRTPEESVARRNARKQHRSLYLPSTVDLDSSKPPIIRSGSSFSLQKDWDSLTKDFLDIENKYKVFQQSTKDSYFSDICSGSYRSRFVKPIVDDIEAKEHKQKFNRDSVLNRSVAGSRTRKSTVSPNDLLFDSSSHSNFSSMESKNSKYPIGSQQMGEQNCVSPAFRAPTPPPRSPKSIEFVNQVLLQHQNASSNTTHFYNEACSLERKKTFRTNTLVQSTISQSSSLDLIKRDLMNCRRKFGNNVPLEDDKSCEKSKATNHSKVLTHHFPPRSPDLSQRLSGSPRKFKLLDFPTSKAPLISSDPGKRWEKLEVDSEKAFNSNESKPRSGDVEWKKCRLFPISKLSSCSFETPTSCDCKSREVPIEAISVESTNGQRLIREPISSPKSPTEGLDSFDSLIRNCNARLCSPESKRSVFARFRRQEDNKTNFSFQGVGSIKENLTNAMEELENAYRSLRISNENLSSERPMPYPLSETCSSLYSAHPHPDRNTLFNGFMEVNKGEDESENQKCSANETAGHDSQTKFRTNSKTEPSIKDALCIDELFGDLTLQLDMEQKLLEEMRQKKASHSPSQRKRIVGRQSPSESSKLQQNLDSIDKKCVSAAQNLPDYQSQEVCAITNIKQRVLARKKHKAVRSLSANIASIMQCDPLVTVQPRTRETENRTPPTINLTDKTAPRVGRASPERSTEDTSVPSENAREERIAPRDEIWQVRVSMDPGKGPETPPLLSETSTFSRLHSVLRRQNENIVQRDEPIHNSKPPSSPPPVRLNENELEKLLTTLLRDVSNKPIHEKKLPSLSTTDNESIFTKGISGYVRKRLLAQNMDPGPGSQSRATNEKQLAELLPSASGLSGNGALDNNSNQNNNDAVEVHCPSFLPARDRFIPGYRVSDDNRSTASHRNSACVENLCNPRTSWLSSRGSGRRHSIGLDDFSNISVYRGHRNFNQITRPPAFHHSQVSHCSSDTAANSSSAVDRCKLICQSELELAERENQNQFSVRSTCNGRAFTATNNFNPAHAHEKFKDKSFVRKSSLNRLEFVEQVCHATGPKSQASSCNQQSSSEANSDQDRSWNQTSVSSSLPKRKSTLNHRAEKEFCGGLTRQDAVPEAGGGMRKGGWFSKHREGSLKLRNRKSPSCLVSHFKKSLSAGEQDSFTDFAENADGNKVCFSAQEIHPQELLQNYKQEESSPLPHRRNSPKPSVSEEPNSQDALNKGSQTAPSISSTCDNSSHISGDEQLPKQDAEEEDISHSVHNHEQEGACHDGQDGCHAGHLDIDQDLFDSHSTVVSSPLHRFPTGDNDLTLSENNEVVKPSRPNTAGSQLNVDGELPSEVSIEGMESLSIKSSSLESDKESVKQPSSILRKKYSEERREIHGILKNADDKLASRLLPSILKHRESSEEKDVWTQSDLHSILKKSTSEEDSSNNSPDIRPILKNTSTDDESSGMSSKPKPILKKRTSFSEECSYACFHSGELKPILKKKSMIDMCEEQPKPILKTRRKSEEAAATTLDFAVGSRPRAYSADRGVMKANEKKPSDDLC